MVPAKVAAGRNSIPAKQITKVVVEGGRHFRPACRSLHRFFPFLSYALLAAL